MVPDVKKRVVFAAAQDLGKILCGQGTPDIMKSIQVERCMGINEILYPELTVELETMNVKALPNAKQGMPHPVYYSKIDSHYSI